ncbi:MAG: NAD(P)H-dependent oxidoreductase [Robiginitalea sp.]|jgi:nitroreductase
MKNALDSLYWRYAVKKFDPERTLPEAKVEALKKAFNLTATSYGLQPIRLVVIRNRELQEQLVRHSYGQKQVADASHVLVICIETTIDRDYIEGYFNKVREVRGTEEDILEPYRKALVADFRKKNPEEIRTWATHQAYLALGNLLTVCAVEQIDSCPMEGFVPEAYDRVLGLSEKGLLPVLVLPVGYRSAEDSFAEFKKVRRDLRDSVLTLEDPDKK